MIFPNVGCVIGYCDLELKKNIDVRHIVLDQKKNSKNILEKVFFYIVSRFFFNWGFVSKHFKYCPSER